MQNGWSRLLISLTLSAVLGAPVALAGNSEVQSLYEEGRSLYQEGRFQEALQLYKQAIAKGLNDEVLQGVPVSFVESIPAPQIPTQNAAIAVPERQVAEREQTAAPLQDFSPVRSTDAPSEIAKRAPSEMELLQSLLNEVVTNRKFIDKQRGAIKTEVSKAQRDYWMSAQKARDAQAKLAELRSQVYTLPQGEISEEKFSEEVQKQIDQLEAAYQRERSQLEAQKAQIPAEYVKIEREVLHFGRSVQRAEELRQAEKARIADSEGRLKVYGQEQLALLAQEQELVHREVQLRHRLALHFGAEGKYPQAIENFRAAIELDPQNPNLVADLAVEHARAGKYKPAIAAYRQVLSLNPQDAQAHYNLGVLLEEYGKSPQEALNHYMKYLELAPNAKDAELVRSWIQDIINSQKG
ncbi:MAG: tetratricopeptide repeat protein [Candidatus Omnitrophica bacterium]|nr:tetratricopeptide repeat protein [Candidatus Omnitrophota bacterium]